MTAPTDQGGLGYGLKWNMGWMHDTLEYLHEQPINRKWHHAVPIQLAVVVPFAVLCQFIAHKRQVLARVCPLVREQCAHAGVPLPIIARANAGAYHSRDWSTRITVPALGAVFLVPDGSTGLATAHTAC